MGFIVADADREQTFSSFISMNHRETILNCISCVCESGKVRWEDGTEAEQSERSGKRDQKRERQGQRE